MRERELRHFVRQLSALVSNAKDFLADGDFDCEEDRIKTAIFVEFADKFYDYLNTKDKKHENTNINPTMCKLP